MDEVKSFWTALQADEIEDFVDLLGLAGKIMKKKIAEVKVMKGGLTNKTFKVVFDDGQIVVLRIGGKGTSQYIDRNAEKHNSIMAAGMGIAPEVYYFDVETGSQLVEFVKLPTMSAEDFNTNPDVLKSAAALMRTLHNSGIKFKDFSDPIDKIEEYVTILEEKGYDKRYEGWDRIYKNILRIRDAYAKNPPSLAPIHKDVLAENFMYDGKTMMLIDWEYGGMGDPYYDVSGIFTENVMSDENADIFMTEYFQGEPTEEQRARVHISKIIYTAYWSAWSLVQIANGKEFDFYWQYGLDRAILVNQYLDHPKYERYLELIG